MTRRKVLSKPPASGQPNSPIKSQQAIDEFQNILQRMPPAEQKKVIRSITISSFQAHMGPLPAPESLDQYNKIIPDGAERIMTMAEKQSSHRINIEHIVISGQVKQSGRGQIFGLIIAFVAIGASILLAMFNHEIVAGIIGGGSVVGLVTVFVVGRKEQKEQLSEKKPSFKDQDLTPNE